MIITNVGDSTEGANISDSFNNVENSEIGGQNISYLLFFKNVPSLHIHNVIMAMKTKTSQEPLLLKQKYTQ